MKNHDTDVITEKKDEDDDERGHWGRGVEFVLSCIGYAVGLGNIWRFPYLCMENGGGAFLIPYFLFLFICGMPLFFMELVIGQYSNLSPVGLWNMCPAFKGIGWGMIIVSGIMCIYYNVIITWVLYYLAMSFTGFGKELPWKSCNNSWNTDWCFVRAADNVSSISMNLSSSSNMSSVIMDRPRSAAEEFWLFNALDVSRGGIEELGGIRWELLLCFIGAWVLTFLCLIKGIKSSGKVVYVTATAPYIFLTIILIRGVTLEGSWKGVEFYIVPDWSQLKTFKIWATAAMQIFYSLGPAWGGLITMASYNKFNHNCLRDAVLVPVVCAGTSFYGGFAIFSVIGHMAHMANQNVTSVIKAGPGLAFVAYPEALSLLPGAPVWSILFFLMLITVGLDSQFATFETMTSGVVDEFPNLLKKYKTAFTFCCCALEFLIGLPLITRAGVFIFQILDWYSAAFAVMVLGLLECAILVLLYNIKKLFRNIAEMIGQLHVLWKAWWVLTWCFLTPVSMMIIVVRSLVKFEAPTFNDGYIYPDWAIVFGWIIASASMIPVPIVLIRQLILKRHNVRMAFRPNSTWKRRVSRMNAREDGDGGVMLEPILPESIPTSPTL